MKTFKEFISETRGEFSQQIANLRRQAQQAMRSGNMTKYAELAQEIKNLQSGEKIEQERNSDRPVHKSAQKGPSSYGGRAQKPKDVITGKTTIGTIDKVARPGTVSSDEIVSGRHTDTTSRSQKGGTVSVRNRGISRTGDVEGKRGPF